MPLPAPPSKAYRCHMCEESFSAMGLLIGHQSAHAGQGLLFCGKCEGLFSCRDQLEQHPCTSCTFICTCGNGFPQYPALLEHMRSHDEGLPPGYPGPAAQARCADTASSHTLVDHLVKQRQQEKGAGRGGGAPAGFGEMVDLKLRFLPVVSIRRQEEEEGEEEGGGAGRRSHKCGVCGWTFVSLDLLIEHHASHGEDAVYGCRRCGRAVSSSVPPERHACAAGDLLGTGGSFRFDGVAVVRGQGPVPLGYVGDVWHRCSVCPMVYRRRGDLEKHQISHWDSKPFRCHRCMKFYLREYSLRKHRCPVSHGDVGRSPGPGSLPVGLSHCVEQTVFIYKRGEGAGPGWPARGAEEVSRPVEVTFRETQNLTQPQPLTLTQFEPQPFPPLQPQPEPRPLLLIQSPLQPQLLPQTLPHLQPQLWPPPLSHFQPLPQPQLPYQRWSPLPPLSQTSKELPVDPPSQSCVRTKGPSWLDPKARLLIHHDAAFPVPDEPEPEPESDPESEPETLAPLALEDDFVFRAARGARTYQRGDGSGGFSRSFVMPEPEPEQSSDEEGAGGQPPEEEEEEEEEGSEPPPTPTKRKLELQFSDEEDDDCVIIEPNQKKNEEEAEEEEESQNPRTLPAPRGCNGTDSREVDPHAGSRDQEEEEEELSPWAGAAQRGPGSQRLEPECGKNPNQKGRFLPAIRDEGRQEEEEGEEAPSKKTTSEPGVKEPSVKPTQGGEGGGGGGNLQVMTAPSKRKLELEFSEEEEEEEEDCVIVEPNQKKMKSEAEREKADPQPAETLPASRGSNGADSRKAVFRPSRQQPQRPAQSFRCLRCGSLFPQPEALTLHNETCSRAALQRGSQRLFLAEGGGVRGGGLPLQSVVRPAPPRVRLSAAGSAHLPGV